MSLSKQQKLDMIRDVELRLAKEELAERYLKHINQIENSDKPLRTLMEIIEGKQQPETEIKAPHIQAEVSPFEVMEKLQQKSGLQSAEELALLERFGEAAKAPFRKPAMDSLSQWEHIGLENLVMREHVSNDIDIQEHYENAQSMSNENDLGVGL
jgi:hypothetical protein